MHNQPQRLARHEQIVSALIVAVAVIIIGLPLYWMLIASFKLSGEIYTAPPTWWPQYPTLENYPLAWQAVPFAQYYLNSVIVTAITTLSKTTLATLTAYALVYLPVRGRDAVFVTVLAGLMVPQQILIVPNFLTIANLGWLNTYQGLILPGAATAFGTFLMRQYFLTLPSEIFEAAQIDGAGHLQRLWTIAVPLARPAIVTTALFAIVSEWNEYLWPLLVTNIDAMRTLPVGVAQLFDSEGLANWGVIMAGTVLVVAPIVVLFGWAQRHIIDGIAAGALKG